MADSLKANPKVPRRLQGSGRLPELDNLVDKTPEELIDTLERFGIDPDIKAIDLRAGNAFRRLEEVVAEGGEPDDALWESIAAQHEREMSGTLRQMTKTAIRLYQQDRMSDMGPLMWVTREDDTVCDSCEPRHGKVKSYAQWESTGLPGNSGLLCGKECRCQLVPVS